MLPRTYCLVIGTVTLTALLLVAAVNVVVDPGSVYLNKWLAASEFDLYAATLVGTEHGMSLDGWNERSARLALAAYAGRFDCAVLGSSRVLMLSTHRQPRVSPDECGSLLNLGVSGAGLEDLVILAYQMASLGQLPRRVYIGVDPWTLKFNADARWRVHEDVYREGLDAFGSDAPILGEPYWQKLMANLLNFDYFDRSVNAAMTRGTAAIVRRHLAKIRSDRELQAARIRPAIVGPFDYGLGTDTAVWLPDGSVVYARADLDTSRPVPARFVDDGYKMTPGVAIDPAAVRLLGRMAAHLKDAGVDVRLLLTPYHRNVWDDPASVTAPVLRAVSDEVSRLGRETGAGVVGSYDPGVVGCRDGEFFNASHAQPACLARVFSRRAPADGRRDVAQQ